MLKVADQADPDSMVVVRIIGRLAMGPMLLFCPAGTYLDLSITRVRPVSDDEVVAEFVPAADILVEAIERGSPTRVTGAVMDDDAGPTPAYSAGRQPAVGSAEAMRRLANRLDVR